MSIWRLVFREILYRKTNFILGVFAVTVAAACVTAAICFLQRHDVRTEERAARQEAELHEKMAAMEDAYRKITKGLGFNVLVLPKEQNLSDLYAEDFASKEMPESYADKLGQAKLASINHILPLLQQKLKWPEQQRTVLLVGTRGEMATLDKNTKSALLKLVPAGSVVLGYELHRSLKLSVGDTITLLGREFKVARLHAERGSKDDITLWINLAEAQKLLGKEGRINAILALECNCASDRLARIRADIAAVLPETQVIEFGSQALARAEVRSRAASEARAAIQRERSARLQEREAREQLFAILVPLIVIACATWAGLLAWGNVRSRVREIGMLRALGVGGRRIQALMLCRAGLIGILGATAGHLIGWLGSWGFDAGSGTRLLFNAGLLGMVLGITPPFSALMSWVPAMLAAQQDPAEALRER